MEYIFIINLFGNISINIIYYKFGQTWTSLTGTNPILHYFVDGGSKKIVHCSREVTLFCSLVPLMQFWNVEFEGALFDQWEGFLASIPGKYICIYMLFSLIASSANWKELCHWHEISITHDHTTRAPLCTCDE